MCESCCSVNVNGHIKSSESLRNLLFFSQNVVNIAFTKTRQQTISEYVGSHMSNPLKAHTYKTGDNYPLVSFSRKNVPVTQVRPLQKSVWEPTNVFKCRK